MVDMVKGGIIPACIDYQNDLTELLRRKKALGYYDSSLEENLMGNIAKLSASLLSKLTTLEKALGETKEERDIA